ncbi:PREDICTED: cytochrome b5-like isoform X2 [Priapulus caudatus]|nr:PREDICTED: cytochrome b5-like isoform X2 [Priapulus caudatus]XP_014666925.1 PREDICTED: cytochrome b5-like isoform X2 [Priapulus caudatus]
MSGEKGTMYRLKEVREHQSMTSLWIIIHNKVYDVTKFVDEHPGGEEVLLEQAGKNGTESFEDVGHSSDARELMQNYCIGELAAEDRPEQDYPEKRAYTEGAPPEPFSIRRWLLPIIIAIGVALVYRLGVTYFADN